MPLDSMKSGESRWFDKYFSNVVLLRPSKDFWFSLLNITSVNSSISLFNSDWSSEGVFL